LIVIESDGRLGNQLFLYAAAAKVAREREFIILVGFQELQAFFGTVSRPRTLYANLWWFETFRRIPRKLFGLYLYGEVVDPGKADNLLRRRGLVPIFLFAAGYCQNERLISERAALQLFHQGQATKPKTPQATRRRCFVHVRRGDYLNFLGGVSLPLTWYLNHIEKLRKENDNYDFVFFSDEPSWLEQNLPADGDYSIFRGSAKNSFFEMAGCDAGILSASSFSWWAAYFAHKSGAGGPYIAPEYWLGWRTLSWFPIGIETNWITYDTV